MRNWVKPQRDELLFRFFEEEIRILRQMERDGLIDLVFMDEVGFSLNPTVPYAWQPRGKQVGLPADRGNSLTLLGCFQLDHSFEAYLFHEAINSQMVKQSLDHFASNIKRKTIMILDQASIHTSAMIKSQIPIWQQQGLFLQFIPAYSPELNLVEVLWKHIKHHWLPHQAYQSLKELENYLLDICKFLGKEYRITFE